MPLPGLSLLPGTLLPISAASSICTQDLGPCPPPRQVGSPHPLLPRTALIPLATCPSHCIGHDIQGCLPLQWDHLLPLLVPPLSPLCILAMAALNVFGPPPHGPTRNSNTLAQDGGGIHLLFQLLYGTVTDIFYAAHYLKCMF